MSILDKNGTERILVFPKIKAKTSTDVLQVLGMELIKENLVSQEYLVAVIEREKKYPTALPSHAPRIAIPHADYTLVHQTAIAIATLEEPVIFYNMEEVNQPLEVQIVILLAVAEPHGQIEMLQKVISIIQNHQLCEQLVASDTKEEIYKLIEPIFRI